MSYTPGTDLGRLREMVGDTDVSDELFTDAYLNNLLSDNNSVAGAATTALRRLLLDPGLLRKKFRGFGQLSQNNLGNFIRIVEEMIRHVEQGEDSIVDAAAGDSAFPGSANADNTALGMSTDEDGWAERVTTENYLLDLKNRR